MRLCRGGGDVQFEAERDIQLSLAGDSAAYRRLMEAHMPMISRVAYKVVGDLNAAADVAQETFLKAYYSLSLLRDPSRLGNWLCGIARTTSIDWLRSNKRNIAVDDLGIDQDHADALSVTADRDVLETVVQAETRTGILRAMDEMPAHYREALLLKYVNQMSYEDIARAINTSVSAVESLLFRGRLLMRERLARLLDEETLP